jgi:hypothetical protein
MDKMGGMNRRGFLLGMLAVGAAPVIIRTPGLIMPIKPLRREFTIEGMHYEIMEPSVYNRIILIDGAALKWTIIPPEEFYVSA